MTDGQLERAQGLDAAIDDDKDARKAGVCYLSSGPGSGLLVSWRDLPCVLTNQHVLPDEHTARRTEALFNYKRPDDRGSQPCNLLPETGSVFCSSPTLGSKAVDVDHLDYTLAQLDGQMLPSGVSPVALWPSRAARKPDERNSKVFVVGHPGGRPRLTSSSARITIVDEVHGTHTADTKGGSSGSPIFLDHGDVPLLGIHYFGDVSFGYFIRLPAIVTDVLKQEITRRAGNGYDASNPDHVAVAAYLAARLAALETQARARRMRATGGFFWRRARGPHAAARSPARRPSFAGRSPSAARPARTNGPV